MKGPRTVEERKSKYPGAIVTDDDVPVVHWIDAESKRRMEEERVE